MSIYRQTPIDLSGISTYRLAARTSKVSIKDFGRALTDEEAKHASALIDSLPGILAAETLRATAGAIIEARRRKRAIIWGLGGHVIKTGLAPVLIDLLRRGFVTAIALNGSGVIHDYEIAQIGSTSEDVEEALGDGAFGMAQETGAFLNEAVRQGVSREVGFGEDRYGCRSSSHGRRLLQAYSAGTDAWRVFRRGQRHSSSEHLSL